MRIFTIYLIMFSTLYAAFERIPQSPQQTGSGFTRFNPEASAIDFLSHPASLSRIQKHSLAVLYTFPFQIKSLSHTGLSFVFPVRSRQMGVAFFSLGKELYRETTFSLAIGTSMGEHMALGLVMNGHELSIKNYGSERTVGISASSSYRFTETIQFSLLYRNLNSPKLGVSRESLPQVVSTVLGYSPTPSLATAIELERDLEFESRYKFGLRWIPNNALMLLTGFISQPGQVTAGIVFRVKGLFSTSPGQISYAIATHPELANSHSFALHFTLP